MAPKVKGVCAQAKSEPVTTFGSQMERHRENTTENMAARALGEKEQCFHKVPPESANSKRARTMDLEIPNLQANAAPKQQESQLQLQATTANRT